MTMRGCAAICAFAGVAGAALADIDSYLVGYQLNYRQTGPAQVVLFGAVFFNAVNGQAGEAATATMVTGSTGASYDLVEVAPGAFQGTVVFADQAGMEAQFPPGDAYTLAIAGGSLGVQSGGVSPSDPVDLPDAIPTFDAGQFPGYGAIDSLNDYTFRFNTFTSGGNLEIVYLEIDAYPSSTRVYLGATSAGAGEFTVPAGTLRLNRRYSATLYFLSYLQTPNAGFVDALSSAAAERTTTTLIRTMGGCPPDFNGDGFLDFFDYTDFVGAFETGDLDADYNGDGFLDFFDYSDFVAGFESGC